MRPFRLELDLPSGVDGPVDRSAFRRFASICASLAIAFGVCGGGPALRLAALCRGCSSPYWYWGRAQGQRPTSALSVGGREWGIVGDLVEVVERKGRKCWVGGNKILQCCPQYLGVSESHDVLLVAWDRVVGLVWSSQRPEPSLRKGWRRPWSWRPPLYTVALSAGNRCRFQRHLPEAWFHRPQLPVATIHPGK